MSEDKKDNERPPYLVIGMILFAVVAFWFVYGNYMLTGLTETDLDGVNPKIGVRGDMYGGLNALFTGLAFAGLIIALALQMKELKLQREELEASTEAQEKLADAMKDSVEKQAYLIDATFKAAVAQKEVADAMKTSTEAQLLAAQLSTLDALHSKSAAYFKEYIGLKKVAGYRQDVADNHKNRYVNYFTALEKLYLEHFSSLDFTKPWEENPSNLPTDKKPFSGHINKKSPSGK